MAPTTRSSRRAPHSSDSNLNSAEQRSDGSSRVEHAPKKRPRPRPKKHSQPVVGTEQRAFTEGENQFVFIPHIKILPSNKCVATQLVRNIRPSPSGGSHQTPVHKPMPSGEATPQAQGHKRSERAQPMLVDPALGPGQSMSTPLSSSPALGEGLPIVPHPNPLRNPTGGGLPLLQPSPQIAVSWQLPGPTLGT